MNIASAKEQIKDAVEAYLQLDDTGMYVIAPVHQRPIFLMGAPGIGKTAIMQQVARELEVGLVSYSMTHHTRQSALGLPRIEQREFEGQEYLASEYTMSEIVAAVYDYMAETGLRQGILFLDEINCVSETLYPSMLQFLQFKTFGKHKVPDGWVVCCAGNPPEYNRSVHEFDIVTLDRMREIDVEPDYAAWREYAVGAGLHSAVTTFLEAKKDCFYKVESKPGGGKAFVTARAWEDLARLIALYESMGKKIDRDVIGQFLRDDGVADSFAVYYALFEKYRSDYQVDSILRGRVSDEIKTRAEQAEFDERLALLGLLLDALAGACRQVIEREDIVVALRDVLRAAKPELLEGGSVEQVLGARVHEREGLLARKQAAGVVSQDYIRQERLICEVLHAMMRQCALEGAEAGAAAFECVQAQYKARVAELDPAIDEASAKIDAVFAFVDRCFSSREMLVFMAELATRKSTTQFVARYGNDSYYKYNNSLKVDSARMGLAERVEALSKLDAQLEGARGAAAGLRYDEQNGEGSAKNTPLDLQEYYSDKKFEYGFAGVCKMTLPVSDMKGLRVLDVCCRRGMGVYKISSMVGNDGVAIGVDWEPAYIEEAKQKQDRAWRDSGHSHNNMEFHVAYPEDLISAGIGNASVDMVYVNNVVSLFASPAAAIAEFSRVLKPGGMLVLETVFASADRDESVVGAAKELGNSIQAALTEQEYTQMLESAGFGQFEVVDEYDVAVNRGFKPDQKVEIAPNSEDVSFKAVSLFVRKK